MYDIIDPACGKPFYRYDVESIAPGDRLDVSKIQDLEGHTLPPTTETVCCSCGRLMRCGREPDEPIWWGSVFDDIKNYRKVET